MTIDNDPLWYKDAIIYEVHVRAFFDSNGDGIGDFRGLIRKLDYLQDLGVTTVWVLPFYPSPLKDDGYDIADYTSVHPSYGTIGDVRQFVREAHRRGLRVITELVCNHTSDQHPWFQQARRAKPGSPARDFYVWSDTPDRYREARIIFKDFESSNWAWDPVAKAYYWHRFYSHQPDLNFDNPRVRQAIIKTMDFWLQMGVDGLRLDAIPYLYEREGTNCENLPETHAFLRELRAHIDARFPGRMLLAEANQWPEDAVAYFGNGDECNMAFHFPVMPRLFMSIQMEDRFPVVDILEQTPPIPDNAQWAMFLRNHDELTLEMVTDEERDYMYRVYARDLQARINLGIRRRLAPLLSNNRRRIELMNGLLLSLPGTPVIYYGDEIGMGDNIYLGDRNGVRTPMQWNADRNAGFSSASRQRLYLPIISEAEYHYEAVNVEAQQKNPQSLLWWMKRVIDLRKRYQAFGRGSLEFLHPDNRKVLAFVRRCEGETILVLANLSRYSQPVELDLREFCGMVPVEMFGGVEFPPIGELPYLLALGPHTFYWFSLVPQPVPTEVMGDDRRLMPVIEYTPPVLSHPGPWEKLLAAAEGAERELEWAGLENAFIGYLKTRPWFMGRARQISAVRVVDTIPLHDKAHTDGIGPARISLFRVAYRGGDTEMYFVPLAFATTEQAEEEPPGTVARLLLSDVAHGGPRKDREPVTNEGVLYNPMDEASFYQALLEVFAGRRRLHGTNGEILAVTVPGTRRAISQDGASLEPAVGNIETTAELAPTIPCGDRFLLKLYRRPEAGINPELEVCRYLSQQNFPNILPVAGALEYQPRYAEPVVLAMLNRYVPYQVDAWQFTLDALGSFFEQAMASSVEDLQGKLVPATAANLLAALRQDRPALAHEMAGAFMEWVRLLGQRTAEMHVVLGADTGNPAFAPEQFSTLYQRSIYQSMRTRAGRAFQALRRLRRHSRGETGASSAEDQLINAEGPLLERLRTLTKQKLNSVRVRGHGDYRLQNVLYTGKDFIIINLEARPDRPASERRIKRSPLRDVAAMMASFRRASDAVLYGPGGDPYLRVDRPAHLEAWAHLWRFWTSTAFLEGYFSAGVAQILSGSPEELRILLDAFMLDQAVADLGEAIEVEEERVCHAAEALLELLDL